MANLTVRNIDDKVVHALKRHAARHNRSAEAEHRMILEQALIEDKTQNSGGGASFDARRQAGRES